MAGPALAQAQDARFVTVACKWPPGLVLRGFTMHTVQEPVLGGGVRDVLRAFPNGKQHTIKGPGAPHGRSPKAPIASGYALTHGVEAELWESWLAANKDSEIVVNGLIFAHVKPVEVDAMARANEARRTGIEAMTPDADPRMPKARTKLAGGAISGLETAAKGV